jgi:hypothetical protein
MKAILASLAFTLLLLPLNGNAQISLEITGGVATYRMIDLKSINTLQSGSLPFETVVVNNFDPGGFINAGINLQLKDDFMLGFIYCYNSTGSRIGQKDYSGYYTFDQVISGHFLCLVPESILSWRKRLGVTLSLAAGLNLTNWKMSQILTVQGLKNEENQSLVASSMNFTPAINLYVPVFKSISVKLSAGYLIDTKGKLHVKGYSDAVLTYKNEAIKTGWSGFRMTGGLIYRISNKR